MEKQQNRNFGKQLAISWQPLRISQSVGNLFATLRISQTVGKQFAISVGIAKFANHIHCAFANFASHIKLQNISEILHCQLRKPLCQLRKPLCQIRNPLPNSQTTLPNSQQHCQIRNPLPNSLALRNSHLQALSSSVIIATDFQTW